MSESDTTTRGAFVASHASTASPQQQKSSVAAPSSSSSLLGRALRGSSYLFLQKIVTFAINSFILRRLHLSVTGAVTVQFELALATVFLFRDSFRLAFLRIPALVDVGATTASTSRSNRQQQLVNVAWISTVVSWVLAVTIALTIARHNGEETSQKQQGLEGYTQALVMYCAAAMIEATAEPMYLLAHSSVLVGWQVSAQGAGFLVRACVQYAGIFVFQLDGLLCYGLAELAYASTLLVVFAWFFYQKLKENKTSNAQAMQNMVELLPSRLGESRAFFDAELFSILMPLSVQSVVKYLLTEGDKWVMSLFTTLQQMGVYGIVFHLGSLVPRIVFFPLEEATKTVVSKMDDTNASEVAHTKRFVAMLLKIMHLIGMVFVCFGVNYAHTLILLLYGAEKAHGGVGSALAMYCLYIPFLGLNGICEAFVHAVGNKQQLMRLNQLMAAFFFIYASSAMLFMWVFELGTAGIILANCVNMSCRILYCMTFIAKYFAFKDQQRTLSHPIAELLRFWRQALPDRIVIAAFGLSFFVSTISQRVLLTSDSWVRHGTHIAVGGACFAVVLLALYDRERHLIRDELRQLKRGGTSSNSKDHVE